MGLLITWAVTAASLYAAAQLLEGMKIEGGVGTHLVIAAVVGVVNAFLGTPLFLAIGVTSLGLGFLFAGLTRVFVLAVMLKLTDAMTSKLEIKSFGTALVAAFVMSVLGTGAEYLFAG